jgi:hypothetical protein
MPLSGKIYADQDNKLEMVLDIILLEDWTYGVSRTTTTVVEYRSATQTRKLALMADNAILPILIELGEIPC